MSASPTNDDLRRARSGDRAALATGGQDNGGPGLRKAPGFNMAVTIVEHTEARRRAQKRRGLRPRLA